MKLSFGLLLMLTLSCGKVEVGDKTNLGEPRPIGVLNALSAGDQNNLGLICNALIQKTTTLPSVLSSSLFFSTSQSSCDEVVTLEASVETLIQGSGANFIFKRKASNNDFIFPEVETATSGLLKEVCGSINSYQNPFVSGTDATYITTDGIRSDDCKPVSGELCVKVERGSQQGNFFIIHTKEWARFKINSNNREKIGFFTYRRKVTRGFCGDEKSMSFEATLL